MDEMLQLPVPYADELVSFSNENGTIGDSHGTLYVHIFLMTCFVGLIAKFVATFLYARFAKFF